MTPAKREVKVIGAGDVELVPPPGTHVVPVLVSDEMAEQAFKGTELAGCGARVRFEDIESGPGAGFTTVTLVSGNKAPH